MPVASYLLMVARTCESTREGAASSAPSRPSAGRVLSVRQGAAGPRNSFRPVPSWRRSRYVDKFVDAKLFTSQTLRTWPRQNGDDSGRNVRPLSSEMDFPMVRRLMAESAG